MPSPDLQGRVQPDDGIDMLLERARSLVPVLRAGQAEAEARTYPSAAVHRAFLDAGFFRALTPRAHGGLELSLKDFYRLVMELARGCPSTAWWFSLGAHHAVNICSYFTPACRAAVFAAGPDFSAPWSFMPRDLSWERRSGGWVVSGTWMFSSGIPHANWFMAAAPLPDSATFAVGRSHWQKPTLTIVTPAADATRLDDWGRILGMKASGSHSGRLEKVFVPDHMTLVIDRAKAIDGPTTGGMAYGNPLYNGLLNGFVEGSLAAVGVGLAYAAIDAYVETVTRRPSGEPGSSRAANVHYQRPILEALTVADGARNMVLGGADTYLELSAAAMAGKAPFTIEAGLRMDAVYQFAEQMVWRAVGELCRNAGSGAMADGQALQRHYRDITTLCTRTGQADHRTGELVTDYFANRQIAY